MRLWLCIILFVLSACGANNSADEVDIDYEADLQAYGTEAANIRVDMVDNRTAIAATVAVGSTQSADFERYNDLLRSTVAVAIPPTSDSRIVANQAEGPLPVEVYDLSSGEMRFVQIGPSGEIDANDCFIAKQQFFDATGSIIFMTAVGLNVRAGTSLRADWQYGGDLVHTSSWVAPQSEPYRCVALAMRSSDVEFFTGNWSVTLSVDGEPDEPRSFTILDR